MPCSKAALMQLQKPKYKQEYLAKKGNPKPKVKTTPDKMVNSVESKNSYGSDHSEDCIMIQEKAECITVADSDEEQGAAVFF